MRYGVLVLTVSLGHDSLIYNSCRANAYNMALQDQNNVGHSMLLLIYSSTSGPYYQYHHNAMPSSCSDLASV